MKRALFLSFGLLAWCSATAQNHFEEFTGTTDDLDLDSCQLRLSWSGSDYTQSLIQIMGFPIDPSTHMDLKPQFTPDLADGSASIALTASESVSLFGVAYTTVHVNANGNLSFGSANAGQQPVNFFDVARIAGLYTDLDLRPERSKIFFAQLSDRIVVTYQDVEQAASANENDFQIEVALDSSTNPGEVRLSWVHVQSGIGDHTFPVWVGLS